MGNSCSSWKHARLKWIQYLIAATNRSVMSCYGAGYDSYDKLDRVLGCVLGIVMMFKAIFPRRSETRSCGPGQPGENRA